MAVTPRQLGDAASAGDTNLASLPEPLAGGGRVRELREQRLVVGLAPPQRVDAIAPAVRCTSARTGPVGPVAGDGVETA